MSGVHYTTQTKDGNRRRRALGGVTAACLVVGLITGCGQTRTTSESVNVSVTEEGFLEFTGGGDEDAAELERINHEIEEIAEEYRDTLDDNERSWTVITELGSNNRILQGTIYITKEETSLLSGDTSTRQVASFAYDRETHTGYDAQNALEADPLTGVELSTKVQKAFNVLEPGADLLATEMQGFLLNDNAATEFFYMRVESDPNPDAPDSEPTEQFYIYDPAVDAMTELTWPTE